MVRWFAGSQALHDFRVGQKRFIVYEPSKAQQSQQAGVPAPAAAEPQPPGVLPAAAPCMLTLPAASHCAAQCCANVWLLTLPL